ncbi:MAG: tripartite tricarboxylate transporter substrate binding protein [Xylophilus ampelinus]
MNRLPALVLSCLVAAAAPFAAAQPAYPSKPVRLIVPFPAGGATDGFARVLSQKLGDGLGQPIVVENRAGAGGMIGSDAVAKAPADGYTLLLATSSTHSIGPSLNPKLPYSATADFTPIVHLADSPNILVVPNSSPARNLKDWLAYARQQGGRLNYGSSGNGTITHLTGAAFQAQTGLAMQHVPYKGTALAMPDLISGQLDAMFDSISTAMPHVRDGRIRALAVTSVQRSPQAPELPPVGETVPGFESTTWFGLYGPKALPAPVVSRLNAVLNQVLKDPDVRERALRLGFEPAGGTPQHFADVVAAQTAKWAKVIKDNRIVLE